MSFLNFEPKEENDLIDLLEVGDGDFEVVEATEKLSKSNGNPMIELKLKVWDSKGQEGIIFDYLMLTASNFSLRKIRHFCFSCGLAHLYDKGILSGADCVGKAGKLKIDFQKGTNGYSDKNTVKDYIIAGDVETKKSDPRSTSAQDEKFDDDIPF
jgi:hypothetical protein